MFVRAVKTLAACVKNIRPLSALSRCRKLFSVMTTQMVLFRYFLPNPFWLISTKSQLFWAIPHAIDPLSCDCGWIAHPQPLVPETNLYEENDLNCIGMDSSVIKEDVDQFDLASMWQTPLQLLASASTMWSGRHGSDSAALLRSQGNCPKHCPHAPSSICTP